MSAERGCSPIPVTRCTVNPVTMATMQGTTFVFPVQETVSMGNSVIATRGNVLMAAPQAGMT